MTVKTNEILCKYYNKHLETIAGYIGCLYEIEGCSTGGLLHILLDDDNCDDDDILYCLGECIKHPEREESKIGRLICEEYLKLSMEERRLLSTNYIKDYVCMEKLRKSINYDDSSDGITCANCFIKCGN